MGWLKTVVAGSEDVTAPGVVVAESSDVVVSGAHITVLEGGDLPAKKHDEQMDGMLE